MILLTHIFDECDGCKNDRLSAIKVIVTDVIKKSSTVFLGKYA